MKTSKRLLALFLALVCTLGLYACNSTKDIPFDETDPFFVAKVKEVYENYLLVEVTNKGTTYFSVGTSVEVSTNVTSADGCPDFVVGEYARIVFNGVVLEKYPPALGEVFRIYKTDSAGLSTAD